MLAFFACFPFSPGSLRLVLTAVLFQGARIYQEILSWTGPQAKFVLVLVLSGTFYLLDEAQGLGIIRRFVTGPRKA